VSNRSKSRLKNDFKNDHDTSPGHAGPKQSVSEKCDENVSRCINISTDPQNIVLISLIYSRALLFRVVCLLVFASREFSLQRYVSFSLEYHLNMPGRGENF
jgi:hypothetical protein